MMKVSEARELYRSHSGRFSENVRWLAAGGFATIYGIAREDFDRLASAPPLLVPLALFVLAVSADAVQYLVTTRELRMFVSGLDPQLSSDEEIMYSAKHNALPEVFFALKGFLLLAGWIGLALGWWYMARASQAVCV